MATIYARRNLNGTVTYRVIVRRKGIPILCLSFETYEEAIKWESKHEEKYLENPDLYQNWILKNRLLLQRKRGFKTKKLR